MLQELRIQRLGVIDEAVLDLHPGLNVVTGETGAGKTMVVTGLGLLPLALDWLFQHLFGGHVDAGLLQNIQKAIFGLLIMWFLIKEPEGLARLLGLRRTQGARRRLFPS